MKLMTKVCHMTTVHPRYDARILKKECVSLAKHGYDVTLLVADNKPIESVDGVKIVSIEFDAKNHMDRILHSSKIMLKKACEINADIYHFHDPELITVGLALIKKGKKVIYDSHEDTPSDIKNKYWIPKYCRWVIAFLFALYEKYAVRKFSAVITVTPSIVRRFVKDNKNTFMVTNYPLLTTTDNNVNEHAITHRHVCFTGVVSPFWSHDIILNALKDTDIKYVLAGKIVNNYLNVLQQTEGSNNLRYIGLVPFEKVHSIHSNSIAGMALLEPATNDKNYEGTLRNQKLFEYMNSGIPVICSNFSLWKDIVEGANCGICVDYDNPLQIKEAVLFLANNPDKALKMGQHGKMAVLQKYNWRTQEEKLLDIYKLLTSSTYNGEIR